MTLNGTIISTNETLTTRVRGLPNACKSVEGHWRDPPARTGVLLRLSASINWN